jgi:hypothetical protein
MSVGTEKRSSERHPHKCAITFTIFNQQNCVDAQALDCGTNGLKFKSTCALQPGTTICIRVKPGERVSRRECFCEALPSVTLAEVKWCRKIDVPDASFYEVGVHFYPPHY